MRATSVENVDNCDKVMNAQEWRCRKNEPTLSHKPVRVATVDIGDSCESCGD